MTKGEICDRLLKGDKLKDILPISDGQDCLIFKTDNFEPGEDVLYIPDFELNGIIYDESLAGNDDEIMNIIEHCYSGNDFIDICDGDDDRARTVFVNVDWCHPSSEYEDMLRNDWFEEEEY